MTRFAAIRRPINLSFAAIIALVPLSLAGCDRTESDKKTSTTTTTQTPEGTKTTTETTEKKIETSPK